MTNYRFSLGTLAWPYAKFDFTEPLLSFSILGALLSFFYFKDSGKIRYLFIGLRLLGFGIIPKSGVNFCDDYEMENAWLPYYGLDIGWLNLHLTGFK